MAPTSPRPVLEGLLERQPAHDQLATAFERVWATDSGEVVTISGEAGVGKTALLRAFTAGVDAEVLWGGCDGLRTPRPLGPLLDIAAAVGGEVAALAGGRHRDALFSATRQLLELAPRPIVVVIEDAHWADDATLDFLTFLGRRMPTTRALLVITYRDDEVGARHPLRVVLGDIAAATRARVRLDRLSLDAVATLAAGYDVDPGELHASTGGNPFYVTESLAAGKARVPDSVRDAVLARAGRLGASARRALDAVAISPGRAELWLVEAVAGSDAGDLDECVEGGVVEVVEGHATLRHELARLAVIDAMPPARRRGLHRRALHALVEAPQDVPSARLAYHAGEADDIDALIVHAPVAANDSADRGAHQQAADHLQDALRHADRFLPAERARLFIQLGLELSQLSQPDAAVDAMDAAIACWQQLGDRREEGRALVLRAGPLTSAARQPEAVASAYAALAVLEPLGPGPELAEAYTSIASSHMLARELDAAIEWSYRGERLAEDVDALPVVCLARIQGGVSEFMAGRDAGLDRINAGIALARELDLENRVALGYSQIGSGAGEIRRYDVAIPALQECRRFSRDREILANYSYASAWLARCELEQGRWDSAGHLTTGLLASLRTVGIARFTTLTTVGRLRARRGDPDVWAPLDEALDLARQTQHLQRLWPVAVARAEAAWLERRIEDEAGLVTEVHMLARSLAYPWAVGELAFWLWRAGEVGDDLPPPAATPFRLHLAGRCEEAATAWRALGCPYEEADALADSSDSASVRSALDIFGSLGARPAVALTVERLRSMGVRVPRGPNRAARANPGGLTDRELEVLALVAGGLSNADLGARLGITAKTAGHHVSSILAKLGVANRAEAAVAAERLGITTDKM